VAAILRRPWAELTLGQVRERLPEFRLPVRERYAGEDGWRRAGLRENPGDITMVFVELRPEALSRYAALLLDSPHWLQRTTKYVDLASGVLLAAASGPEAALDAAAALGQRLTSGALERLAGFVTDVREEYFSALAHLLDSRYYRTHASEGRPVPAGKYAAKRRGYVVSMGEDLAAVKMSGWTHAIPEYFDFDHFWPAIPARVSTRASR